MPLKHGPIEATVEGGTLIMSQEFSMPLKHGPIEATICWHCHVMTMNGFPCP